MCIVNIALLGDSHSSGLRVDFSNPKGWFNMTDHHGSEDFSIIDSFDNKKAEFLSLFRKKLAETEVLKQQFPKVAIRLQTIARPGINLAHYPPAINPTVVPEQFYGPLYAQSQAANFQADFSIIALGGNDSQDYNTMAIEMLLNTSSDEDFETILGAIATYDSDLAKTIKNHTTQGDGHRYSNLMATVAITREQNQAILNEVKQIDLKSEHSKAFVAAWENKKYWNKNQEELQQTLTTMKDDYQSKQHVAERGAPFAMAFIIPPNFTGKDVLFPSFHTVGQNIPKIRDAVKTFAKENDCQLIDMDIFCKQMASEGITVFGADKLHFSSECYDRLETIFPFTEIITQSVQTKLSALLNSYATKGLISSEALEKAQSELDTILSTINPQKASLATLAGSVKSSPLNRSAQTPEATTEVERLSQSPSA